MPRHTAIDWGILGWTAAIAAGIAPLTWHTIAMIGASDSCTASGGHEVLQYFVPGPKGTLIPIYACEKP